MPRLLEFLSLNLYRYPFLVQCKHNTAVRGEIISEEQHQQRSDASLAAADDDTKYTELRWFDTSKYASDRVDGELLAAGMGVSGWEGRRGETDKQP